MTYDAVTAAVARGTQKRLFLSLGTAHFRRQTEVALDRAPSLGTSVGGLGYSGPIGLQ